MNHNAMFRIKELITRYPSLVNNEKEVISAVEAILNAYRNGNKLMICGNGGSASDAIHIVGELMKEFVCTRPIPEDLAKRIKQCKDGEYLINNLQMPLNAISLVSEIGLMTAYANDVASDMNFAQQVFGQGKKGDILIAISTSGNSKNVIYAAEIAKMMNIGVVSLTGATGGQLKEMTDILINVPEKETFKIQELHLPVYHAICLAIEAEFFGKGKTEL